MGLFDALDLVGNPSTVDWEMTPDYSFGTFESWGGRERVRSNKERIYYFFIDAWGPEPKLCLMERGIKYARIVAEILAPPEMLRRCVDKQGKVALFERTHPIDAELKQWLISHVMDTEDNSKVRPIASEDRGDSLGPAGLPQRDQALPPGLSPLRLPDSPADLVESEVQELIQQYKLLDHERNPTGSFTSFLVDTGDGLTVTDKVTGLMWQRGGLDIMSHRMMMKAVEEVNSQAFAGFSDWRLPSLAEALSLIQPQQSVKDQYLHPAFAAEQPFIFVDAVRRPGGQWFVDFKQGRAYWASGTIPGGFGRLCRRA